MKNIYVVTGAAGHLGGCIAGKLLSQGRDVRALVMRGERCEAEDIRTGNFSRYEGDVCRKETLEPLFEGTEGCELTVIHCAGIITIESKRNERVRAVNVDGTANIIDACRRHGAKRLVYVSSVHAIPERPKGEVMPEIEYFDPNSVTGCYAKTKAEATQLVLDAADSGLDAVVVHPAGIIGPDGQEKGNIVHLIINYLSGRLPAAVKGGFDFVDVRDVASGIISAAERGRSGECYILSNKYIDLREFFDTLSAVSERKRLKVFMPIWFTRMIAPFAELYYRISGATPLFTLYSLHTLSQNASYSHDKATRELGYKTRPLKESLSDTVKWLKRKGLLST